MKWGKKVKVPVQNAWVGQAGSLPPPPLLRWRSCGGGGRVGGPGPAWGFWAGKGGISGKQAASWNGRFFWRVNLADYSRRWIRQVATARYFGGLFWRIYLAGHFGAFIWRVFTVNETGKLQSFKEKEKKRKGVYNQWICKLHHEHCI